MSPFCGRMGINPYLVTVNADVQPVVNPFFPENVAREEAAWMRDKLIEAGHPITIENARYEIYRWYIRPTTTTGMRQDFISNIIYRRQIVNQIMNEFTEDDSDRTYATDNTDDGDDSTELDDP